jgi:putative Ca2+/H+ antiporter (TMEM165/GDT1 family)
MVATLVLATRYRPLPVWCGVAAAFFIQCLVAVLAGHLITRLPQRPVLAATAVLFAIGAVVMFRGAGQAAEHEIEQEEEYERRVGAGSSRLRGWQQGLASFGVLFAAEWGDLSQLATAGLVVRTGEPLSVFLGAWLALVLVAGLAVGAGRAILRSGPLKLIGGLPTVRRLAGGLFALLSVITAAEAAGLSLPW